MDDNSSPMYALYEEAGKFHAGRVMSEADSSMQVELDSGKRVKVKSTNVMLKFDKPQPCCSNLTSPPRPPCWPRPQP